MNGTVIVVIAMCCFVSAVFVSAGTYILINGNHYLLCGCAYLAAFLIMNFEYKPGCDK